MECPCLGPPHVRDAVRQEPTLPEVEEPSPTVHILQHPIDNPVCEVLVFLTFSGEEADCLGRRMDVYRIDPVVIVFRCSIFEKEIPCVVLDTLAISRPVLRC